MGVFLQLQFWRDDIFDRNHQSFESRESASNVKWPLCSCDSQPISIVINISITIVILFSSLLYQCNDCHIIFKISFHGHPNLKSQLYLMVPNLYRSKQTWQKKKKKEMALRKCDKLTRRQTLQANIGNP